MALDIGIKDVDDVRGTVGDSGPISTYRRQIIEQNAKYTTPRDFDQKR